ncbi:C40 family peptidase [Histomonas meleagridis]|uniref:C40 family peptidase n=1 Tax=Histomonas meleagridis TaxID=135588 RepID=UPI003559ACBB|nr:C40 family peptidase [Histomonas meleagridis]KAH0796262.1 C40 family peptidase [Histomonas meleagridis]
MIGKIIIDEPQILPCTNGSCQPYKSPHYSLINNTFEIEGEESNFYVLTYRDNTGYISKESVEVIDKDYNSNSTIGQIIATEALSHNGKLSDLGPAGFTKRCHKKAEISITSTVSAQSDDTNGIKISRDFLKPGDNCIFTFGGQHCGIYVGGNAIIHIPSLQDYVSKVSPTYVRELYARRHF